MRRLSLIILLCLIAITTVEAQLLYKISGNGLEKPSYIFGTYHFASEKFVDEVPGLRDVLESVEQVCGEVASNFDQKAMMKRMLMPDGLTYNQLLDAEHYEKLNAKLRMFFGADLTNAYIGKNLGSLNPATMSLMLQMLEPADVPNADLKTPLDPYFDKYAKLMGMPSLFLETQELQLEVFFGASIEEQVAELVWWLDNYQNSSLLAQEMVQAYMAQDIKQATKCFDSQLKSGMYSKKWQERAIDQRNKNWVELMPSIMADKSTLFYVGLAHLDYGKNSLFRLLRKAGYTVTPLL